jgi:TusE/DsrC/DsvC family sulfur relay protein
MRTQVQVPEVQFDEDRLLLDPEQWSEALARFIAVREEVGELREQHWQIIYALRAHYARFGAAPAMIQVCRLHGQSPHWVQDLFHTCLNAWRVAGLPNPGEEAKSYLSDM